MILVTGATGTVGIELVKRLWAAGAPTRALVHDASKADVVRRPNVEIAQGDFSVPETLAAALEEVDTVFLASPPGSRQVETEGKMIKACVQAKVKHIVKLSTLKPNARSAVPFLKWHGQIEQELRESQRPFTSLQPNYFMQNLLRLAANISSTGAIQLPMKNAAVSMVDIRDVAEVAMRVLTAPDRFEGQSLVLTGPEAITFPEVADKLTIALGRRIRYTDTRPDDARKAMIAAGFEDWDADAALKEAAWFVQGQAAEVTQTVNDVTDSVPHSFGSFAEDYADIFMQLSTFTQEEERRAA
jgi:uncharacterized protein YbjT (DUF2867 family)